MSADVFEWRERGDSLEVGVELGGGVRVLVDHDGERASVVLEQRAVEALTGWLDEAGESPLFELEQAVAELTSERDELQDERAALIEQRDAALRRVNYLEALVGKLTEALEEQAQRVTELRIVLAGDANQDAIALLDRMAVRS